MRRRAGFTLVEILVGALVLAIVMGMLALAVQATVQRIKAVSERRTAHTIGPQILGIIAADLRCAYAYGFEDEHFQGDDEGSDDRGIDELLFVTSVDSKISYQGYHADINEVGYFGYENDLDGGDYVLHTLYRREDWSVDKKLLDGGKQVLLYDRVVSLNFMYYPPPEIDPEGEDSVDFDDFLDEGKEYWDPEDEETAGLPYAVGIVLRIMPVEQKETVYEQSRIYEFRTFVTIPSVANKERVDARLRSEATRLAREQQQVLQQLAEEERNEGGGGGNR